MFIDTWWSYIIALLLLVYYRIVLACNIAGSTDGAENVYLFLHSYEADFIDDLNQKKEHHLTRSFNLSFRYIDDLLSLNNPSFGDLIDRIYPKYLEIKDTTKTVKSDSNLDPHLKMGGKGKLLTKLYEKLDDFSFRTVNFCFICGNIPSALAYGVFIPQLIRYTRAWRKYADFLYRAKHLEQLGSGLCWLWTCYNIEVITTEDSWSSSRTRGSYPSCSFTFVTLDVSF